MRRDVRSVKWKPVSIAFVLALSAFFGIVSFYGSEIATGTVVGGRITVDTTWDLARSPFIAMENVIVDPGVTLTIEPGVQVKFDPPGVHDYLSIYIEGNLVSVGQLGNAINFTSNALTPWFDWGALQINATGNASIENCSFAYGDGLILASSTSHNITRNHFSNYSGVFSVSSGNRIEDNTFENESGVALQSQDNVIVNNVFSEAGVVIDGTGNFVLNNTVSNDRIGISIQSGSNLVNGNILRNITDYAIEVRGSSNTISSNSITSCNWGIDIWLGNNTIQENYIEDCYVGIEVGNDDRIRLNMIRNASFGIVLANSDGNLVVGNEVSLATFYGLYLTSGSTNNTIFHNSFLDNVIQAKDDLSSNSWDNGYPSGGNYWSDYQGNDSFWGPNQDVPGSDGIGDTPYLIATNGTDNYPLTEPTIGNIPPRNLNARLTGTNSENVTLTWNLSWNDGQRANDVTGYEIYRSSTYDNERIGYSLIGSTPNQTTQYVDSFSGEGDPNNYFYYVCAINGTGNSSCTTNQAAKFTRTLSKGPNLVSIPLIQSDETIQTVIQTLSYDKAWSYDPINQEWKSFSKSKPYGQSLEYLNHTIGIWVNVTQDSNFTVAGVVPTSTTIDLQAGWNLVGFPSFDDNYMVADLKAAVSVQRIEGFDNLNSPYFLRVLTDGDSLQAGFGYWINVASQTVWTVRNS